jgi:hypothetical protein
LNLESAGLRVNLEDAKEVGVGNRFALHQFGRVIATGIIEKSTRIEPMRVELTVKFDGNIDADRLAEMGRIEILDSK